jgi:hypothetical protein
MFFFVLHILNFYGPPLLNLLYTSLHLTTFCLQYKPTVIACVCIHLACKWSNWEIPVSTDGKHWWEYVDPTVTLELLDGKHRSSPVCVERMLEPSVYTLPDWSSGQFCSVHMDTIVALWDTGHTCLTAYSWPVPLGKQVFCFALLF